MGTFAANIDNGLIHELMHQIGVIDMYRMNVEPWNNLAPTRTGRPSARSHSFPDLTLMAGGYANNIGNDPLFLDETTSYALNLHRRKRRGYYGEYLWDTPKRTTLRFLSANGGPLPNASLAFFQKRDDIIPTQPTFSGKTNVAGEFVMPNRSTPRVEQTATGHVLRPNPFGATSVVGDNGVMLIRIRQAGQEEFRWLEIIQLNEAFWRGERNETTIEFQTQMVPGVRDAYANNLARKAIVTASSTPETLGTLTDGTVADKFDGWNPEGGKEGEFVQFDLRAPRWINTMVLWPTGDGHDWYERFRVEVSLTGAFSGEQRVAFLEPNWDETRTGGAYRIQRSSGLRDHVDYRFQPVFARYVRITGTVQQNWVGLREVEIYPCVLP